MAYTQQQPYPPQYPGKDAEAGAPLVHQQGYPPQGGYPPQQQTVIVQPQATNHPDYLGFSIFNCLCCCWCIAIAALIKSCNTRDANLRGDPNAKNLSREALTLNKVALGVGIGFHLIWIIILIVLVVTGIVVIGQAKKAGFLDGFDSDSDWTWDSSSDSDSGW